MALPREESGAHPLDSQTEDFYALGKEHDIICSIKGYFNDGPIHPSRVKWFYQEWDIPLDVISNQTIIEDPDVPFKSIEEVVNPKLAFDFQTELSIMAEQSAKYGCSVCLERQNLENGQFTCNKKKQAILDFLVSDFSEGFQIKNSDLGYDKVVEDTNFTLTCGASAHKYTKVEWLKKDQETEIINAKSRKTDFDITSDLVFEKVKLKDKGIYECSGTLKDGGQKDVMEILLQVEPNEEPYAKKDNNMFNNTKEVRRFTISESLDISVLTA